MKFTYEDIEMCTIGKQAQNIVSKQLMEDAVSFGTDWEGFTGALLSEENKYVGKHQDDMMAGKWTGGSSDGTAVKAFDPWWWYVGGKKYRTRELAEKHGMVEFTEPKSRIALPGAYTSAKGSVISAMKKGIAIEEGMSREELRKKINAAREPANPYNECLRALKILNINYPKLAATNETTIKELITNLIPSSL